MRPIPPCCAPSLFLLLLVLQACRQVQPGGPLPADERTTLGAGLTPTLQPIADDAAARITGETTPARMEEFLKGLTRAPHLAGTPADLATANLVHAAFLQAGLESRIEEYEVLLPRPIETSVEMLMPVAFQAALAEDPTDLDIDTHAADAVGPYLAFAADGDVTGPLVYANRGTQKDFADLRAAGIDPRGAIGIVRYGDVYRGAKLLNAQAAGLAGLLIYSDPADDGYVRGLGYPQGPWRPESAVQRGSVLDIALAPGDPLTPGEPSIPTVDRLDLEDVAGLPRIPALPLSWRDARPLLEALDGQTVPATWQGGLPFTYHVGGTGTTLVRLRVRSDWRIRRIWNVIGLLKGSAFPDAWIVAGAHRDAWVHGAADPGSGTTVLVEAARVLGNLARTGLRPSRSIVFCSWDAEEYGLIGSTEWVEEHRDRLREQVRLYVNCDTAVTGDRLRISGTPETAPLLAGALGRLADDRQAGASLDPGVLEGALGALGGGSDFVPFLHHLGLPSVDLGSSGPYGVYHSLYDTFGWMKRFGDPAFASHARIARALALILWIAGTASALPWHPAYLSHWIRSATDDLGATHPEFDTEPLSEALDRLDAAAERFVWARRAAWAGDPDPLVLSRLDAVLAALLRDAAVDPEAPALPFHRNGLVAPDPETAYRPRALPRLAAALASGDEPAIRNQTAQLRTTLLRLAAGLDVLSARHAEQSR